MTIEFLQDNPPASSWRALEKWAPGPAPIAGAPRGRVAAMRTLAVAPSAVGGAARAEQAAPHRVYNLDLRDLARGKGLDAARLVSWRYLRTEGGGLTSIEVNCDPGEKKHGIGGSFTGPSVVVATSNDGGLSWSNPVTVARGQGAVNGGAFGQLIFQDKEFIAADSFPGSPFRNRVYVTWTSFQERGVSPFFRFPIMVSFSDDGQHWSPGQEISGSHAACTVQFGGGTANECDEDQDSYPAVAPNGKVYVTYENFNTPAENQLMAVSSTDGGNTWSAPIKVDNIFDINFPINADGRETLTGCQFRVSAKANTATDPSDPTGNTVYAVWADNRNGNATATNTDVFLGRSADGGATWNVITVDSTANDQFYPWVSVAPDGRVDVGYMDRSYSAGQSVCQHGFTLARLTFDAAGNVSTKTTARVDSALSDPGHSRWFSGATNGNSLFIGDYNGVATGSDGKTWSLWTDQRIIVANPPSATRNHGQHAVGAKTP